MTDAQFYRLAEWAISAVAFGAVVALVWCVYRIVQLTGDDDPSRGTPR